MRTRFCAGLMERRTPVFVSSYRTLAMKAWLMLAHVIGKNVMEKRFVNTHQSLAVATPMHAH